MSSYILVIDESKEILTTVEASVAGAWEVTGVPDVKRAKAAMIAKVPSLILCKVNLPDAVGQGFAFCREMNEHPQFTAVPLILVGQGITEEQVRRANDSGAAGLVNFPIRAEMLRNRLVAACPELAAAISAAAKSAPAPQAKAAESVAKPAVKSSGQKASNAAAENVLKPAAAAAGPTSNEHQKKLQLAQNLLAKVLHNLKTSDLLPIVEEEDVPRVVYEMTKKICGISGDEHLESSRHAVASEQGAGSKSVDTSVELNLDEAFGLAKPK